MLGSQVQNLGLDTSYADRGLFNLYTVTRGKHRKSTSNSSSTISYHIPANSLPTDLPTKRAAYSEDLREPFNISGVNMKGFVTRNLTAASIYEYANLK